MYMRRVPCLGPGDTLIPDPHALPTFQLFICKDASPALQLDQPFPTEISRGERGEQPRRYLPEPAPPGWRVGQGAT